MEATARNLSPKLAHLFANLTRQHQQQQQQHLPDGWTDLLENALIRYDSDKTGLFDFALESAGGSVVSIRCTEMYRRVSSGAALTFLGIPLWYPSSNNPRTAIQPGALPGECWPFKGARGHLVIRLSQPIRPEAFSIEHITKAQSPNGKIDSAPR